MSTVAGARAALVALARQLLADGLVVRTWGNFSVRTAPGEFLITPSGRQYATMREEDLAEVGPGREWSGTFKPSSEHPMHAIAYDTFDDVGCVLHTHQPYASALSLAGRDLPLQPGDAHLLGQDVLPISAYGLPGTKRLHRNVQEAFAASGARVLLLEAHGAFMCAQDPETARRLGNDLEVIAQRLYAGMLSRAKQQRLPEVHSRREGERVRYFGADGAELEPEAATRSRHERCYRERPDVTAIQACTDAEVGTFFGGELKPYLDDFAQLVGVKADATTRHNVVLLDDEALCLGKDADNAHDLALVLQKNARAARVAQASRHKPIAAWECLLMHVVYQHKYSKQAD